MVGDHPFGLKLLPVKNHLYVTNVQSNDVSIVDLTKRQEIKRIKVGKKPYCITFSMDGKKSFVTNQYSDSISIINTESLLLKKQLLLQVFPKVLILTVHLLSLSVGLMRKSLPLMRGTSQL